MIHFPLILLALLSVSVSAQAAPQASVLNSDGSSSIYQLLPVVVDPEHAAVVGGRQLNLESPSTLPDHYDITPSIVPPVRDQGKRGTCTFFATTGALESHYMAESAVNQGLKLSEECFVDVRNWMHAQGSGYLAPDKPQFRADDGDFAVNAIQTVIARGIPQASLFGGGMDCRYVGTRAGKVSVSDYENLFASGQSPAYGKGLVVNVNNAPNFDAIRTSLLADIPVVLSTFLYARHLSNIDWDIEENTSEDPVGGHTVLLTGYEVIGGKFIFHFKNSWTERWGRSGYGTISQTLLAKSWSLSEDYDSILILRR